MAWSDSRILRNVVASAFGGGPAFPFGGGSPTPLKSAVYGNSITPNVDGAAADTTYGAGPWAAAGEKTDSTRWPAGGLTLTGRSFVETAGGIVQLNADDLVSPEGTTLLDVHGDLVYAPSVGSGRGVVYHYYGGPQSVTSGTFSVAWHDSEGVFRFEV